MVNVPKARSSYCKKCASHKNHKVSLYKQGKPNPLSQGSRRYARKQRGYNGQTKPIQKRKYKVTKKPTLKLECTTCKSVAMKTLKRAKHIEIGGEKKVKGQALTY